MSTYTAPPPAPDWYPDPDHDDRWRYWNGREWTNDYASRPPTIGPPPSGGAPLRRPSAPDWRRWIIVLAAATIVGGGIAGGYFFASGSGAPGPIPTTQVAGGTRPAPGADNSTLVVGKWQGPPPLPQTGTCGLQSETSVFASDGTFTTQVLNDSTNCADYSLSGTWTLTGDTLNLHITGASLCPSPEPLCSQLPQDQPLTVTFSGNSALTVTDQGTGSSSNWFRT